MYQGIFVKKLQQTNSTGAKIRRIRTRKQISSTDLGGKCGITDSAVRHYENDVRLPNDDKLKEIAAALGVNVSALYDRKIESISDIMHILFELETDGFLIPGQLQSDDGSARNLFGIHIINGILGEAIEEWCRMRSLWETDKISDEEYQTWKETFPLQYADETESLLETENLPNSENTDTIISNETVKAKRFRRKGGLRIRSLESRLIAMHCGSEVSPDLMSRICKYVNCSEHFLNDSRCIEYVPNKPSPEDAPEGSQTLSEILDLMDKHADTEHFRTIQVQLSRIVLYHLAQKGFTQELFRTKEFISEKMAYLYTGKKPRHPVSCFGLYFSELCIIMKKTGISFREMFTGQ